MSANIYRGGIIGGDPADSVYPYKSGVWGVGQAGMTYDDWLQTPPAFLSSAKLWLDAADLSTITEAGGAVSQWDNKGTLGDFTQGTAALQPTTGATTLNGRNVIDFSYDNLNASTAADWTFMNNGTTFAVFAVVKATVSADNIFMGTSDGNWIYTGFTYNLSTNNTFNGIAVLRGVGSTFAVSATTGAGTISSNNWYVLSTIADPDNATASARASLFINNGSAVANNTQTSSVDTGAPDFPMQIGAAGNGTYDLVGSIGEIIVLDGSLATETNRQTVRDYLNAKWAVY